jgi:hypothetical protein
MAGTYSDLRQSIQDCFNEAGAEIMSPHYAQIRDGNQTTIPEEYLAEGYKPGGIRITSVKECRHLTSGRGPSDHDPPHQGKEILRASEALYSPVFR